MSINSGRYIITNAKQRSRIAFLSDPNDGTPLTASLSQDVPGEKWFVTKLPNDTYTFRNIDYTSYANAGNRALEGGTVEGRRQQQEWDIQETRVFGQFTIATIDTRVIWSLEVNQSGTPVTLSSVYADTRNWWTFTYAD